MNMKKISQNPLSIQKIHPCILYCFSLKSAFTATLWKQRLANFHFTTNLEGINISQSVLHVAVNHQLA